MFLDENGRIFGKLNILDVIIVAFIVLVLVFGGLYFAKSGDSASDKVKVKYTVEVLAKDAEYVEHIVVGENVVDGVTKQDMGKIVDFYTKDAIQLNENRVERKFVASKIPGKFDVYVTMELDADIKYPDIISGGEEIKIGSEVALRAESAAMHGYIVGIDYDQEEIRGRK